jgi:hypothetical protein
MLFLRPAAIQGAVEDQSGQGSQKGVQSSSTTAQIESKWQRQGRRQRPTAPQGKKGNNIVIRELYVFAEQERRADVGE